MPHKLMKPDEMRGHTVPLLLSARVQCACQTQEVITIQVVVDLNLDDDILHWTLDKLIADTRREVRQHMNRPAEISPAERDAIVEKMEKDCTRPRYG